MKNGKNILVYFVAFFFGFLLSFFFVYSLLRCIQKFVEIDPLVNNLVLFGVSFLFSIINTILFAVDFNKWETTKISFWMRDKYPKMIIAYVIILIFLGSITNKNIWKAEEINDVLNIEWTIFGLSITIFLVWEIVINYLKKSQPTIDKDADFEQKYKFLQDKQTFSQIIDFYFFTVLLLVINLILLLFSTALVYVARIPENLITQNMIICTFFFSTNTILRLLLDIIEPFIKEKKRLKENNKVSKEELDAAEGKAILQTIVDTGIKTINEMEDIPEERKAELKVKYLELIKAGFSDDNQSNQTEKEDLEMTNNKLSQYILHYLTEDKTNSAIMLTAPWGTGKSYYIQKELIPFLEKPENGSHKCIVVSLYGLTSILEISQSIYLELRTKKLKKWWTKHVSSRFSKKVRSVSREVVYYGKSGSSTIIKGLAGKIGFKLDVSDKDLSMIYNSIDFTDKLLILEDLERTSISIDEVLGYVNNLVEQDGVKVLLVANEEKILQYKSINEDNAKKNEEEKPVDKNGKDKEKKYSEVSEKYIQIKEKTISDTIRFESSLSSALKEIIDSFHDVNLDRFASDAEQTALYDFCVENEIINLRTFVFACQKTVDIYQAINLNADEDADFIKTIFYSIILFSQRLKSGEESNWREGEIFSIELATEKYPLFRFCYDYITQHVIDVSKVDTAKEALEKLRLYDRRKSAGDPDLGIIYYWWICSESDVLKAVDSVTERLRDESDISFYEYGMIARCFVSIKHVIDCDIEKAKELLIGNLKGKGKEIHADNIFTFFLSDKEDPAVVKEITQLKKDMKNSLNSMDEAIYGFDYQPASIPAFEKNADEKHGEITSNGAFASRLDNDKIISMLKLCSAEQIQQFRLVYYRVYESINIRTFLPNDKDALVDLQVKVKALKEYKGYDKIQQFQIGFFDENLKEALLRYNVSTQ